ncbi:MAG: FAD-dependent oxidoreductase [Actinobacteria bacterium]|nr:FAD-dependent oxidoreductase [Actinomycetota bacterium]
MQGHKLPLSATCDVLVVGGGAAGIAAAIAAARSGAETMLVERYGFLGGLATTALVGAFCGLFTTGPKKHPIVAGVCDELITRLRNVGGAEEKRTSGIDSRLAAVSYDPELFKFVAEQMALEAGVKLLYHTLVVDVLWETPGAVLKGVIVENKSGRSAILGHMIIDTSGDADVAARAEVDFENGDGQGGAQAMTSVFKVNNVVSGSALEEAIRSMRAHLVAAQKSRRYEFNRVDPVVFPSLPKGTVSVNLVSVRGLKATDAGELSAAEIEGRRQVFEYLRALRDFVPGFENAQLVALSPQIGVRETRRILGEYVLTGEDVVSGTKFEDGIGLGAWPVEVHNPETGRIEWRYIDREDEFYSIPFSCLVPKRLENLLVAGRCASTAHVAQASTRVMAQALAMGEAAGAAMGLAFGSGRTVRALPTAELQAELKKRGVLLELPGNAGERLETA